MGHESSSVQNTVDGISSTIFSFADNLVSVAADAFAPRLNAQGDLVFGPEPTALPGSDTGGAVIIQQPSQGDRFNTILIIGAIGLGLILLLQ